MKPAAPKNQFRVKCKDCGVHILGDDERKMWDRYEMHRSDNHKRVDLTRKKDV